MFGLVDQRTYLTARPVASSLAALAARFKRDEDGSVALMFSLMVIPCVMFVGVAVDYGRVMSVKQQAQGILDNAVLAGGRAAQTATTNYDTVAQTAAAAFYAAQKVAHTKQSAISGVASNAAKTEFEWTATSWVATPFLASAEILKKKPADTGAPSGCTGSGWQCQKITVKSSALLQAGGTNNDVNIETSMMLDVTGSMDGQKIIDLRAAAKDLVDIVVWNDQSKVTSRVALSPFADAVNVGTTLAPTVRGNVTTGTNPTTDVIGSGYQFFKFNKASGSGTLTYKISPNCVTERIGTEKYTDVAPTSSTTYVGRAYLDSSGGCSLVNSSDSEVNLLTPLTNDKTVLQRRIGKLTIAGSTAGQIGTAWAWYMLSPSWSSIVPAASKPGSYTDTKVKKIAVLMTDGDYNTEFWNGVESKDSYGAKSKQNASNGTSESQAATLCTNMKAKGIEVYTVGFQVSAAAKTLLTNCATNAAHYYDATSGVALKMAFRDIALKISSLRLSK